ncbi:MAG: efflux RND transporter periplasmic adaptor subunit [Planctomycetes bacterium]|nr:efflux RND transporter periplasmic adaptor subunit [Planctomycetota bacterium]
MRKIIVGLVLALILLAIGWRIFENSITQNEGGQNFRGGGAVAVETETVRKVNIEDIRLFTGTLLPQSRFVVAPKIGGQLEELTVQIGDTVKSGQLIAKINDDEYQQNVQQSKAELEVTMAEVEQAEALLNNSKREYERVIALREKKITSESELDTAESEYKTQLAKSKVALSQKAQKEAALKAAEVRLSYTEIYASWDSGSDLRFIGERFVDEGEMLTANNPLVSIIDIDKLIAVIHVIERDYPHIQVGQDTTISTDAYPEETFTGKIIRIAPLLMTASRQARVEIEVPNSQRLLKPGMFVRVQIQFARHENAITVPQNAIVRRNGQDGVFLVNKEAGKAEFVQTKIGINNGQVVEILEPEISGEVVVLGHHLLVDGSAILLQNSSPEASEEKPGKPEQPQKQEGNRP